MPLTPADIHNIAFRKPSIGKRGYDEEEVDAFLDEVVQDITRLLEENDSLRGGIESGVPSRDDANDPAELVELRHKLQQLLAAKATVERTNQTLQLDLQRAHEQRARERAAATADTGARSDQRLEVLAMAQRTSDEHIADARREAEEVIAQARDRAQQMITSAQAKASTLEGTAFQRYETALSGLESMRADLELEVENLARLERDYRTLLGQHAGDQMYYADNVPKMGTPPVFDVSAR